MFFLHSTTSMKIIFSDIDGTLAHYEKHFKAYAKVRRSKNGKIFYEDKTTKIVRECIALPTLTSGDAYISQRTLELIGKIRSHGVLFALISGARTTTFIQRMKMLPEVDIAIAENGGKIYERKDGDMLKNVASLLDCLSMTAPKQSGRRAKRVSLKLDKDWIKTFEKITGEIPSNKPPEKRNGVLWNTYKKLKDQGYKVDAKGYDTAFRVHLEESVNKSLDQIQSIIQNFPKTITVRKNLGKIDFYPTLSGKGNAVKFILKRYKIKKTESLAIFDDDNDLPMAEAVGKVMISEVTSESVEKALKKHKNWIRAKERGILAIEELLEKALSML